MPLQPVVMATKESVVVMERPRPHSTVLDRQATQVFETLAKKLHRLESRGMCTVGCRIRNGCMLTDQKNIIPIYFSFMQLHVLSYI